VLISPLPGFDSVDGEPQMSDTWPMRRQTYGYLPSCKSSPSIGWYQIILLGDKGICVLTTLPRVALDSGEAGIRTRDLLIASPAPYHCTTEPHTVKGIYSKLLPKKIKFCTCERPVPPTYKECMMSVYKLLFLGGYVLNQKK